MVVHFIPEGASKPLTDFTELIRENLEAQVKRDHIDTIREHKIEGCWLTRGFLACPICPDCVYCGKVHR